MVYDNVQRMEVSLKNNELKMSLNYYHLSILPH